MSTPEEETQKPFSLREDFIKNQIVVPEGFIDNSERITAVLTERGFGQITFEPIIAPAMSNEEIQTAATGLIEAFQKLERFTDGITAEEP